MLDLPEPVSLYDVEMGTLVQAKLVRLDRKLAATGVDGTWWKLPISKKVRDAEGDHHWVWKKLVGEHRNDITWDSLAIQNEAGDVEGAMLYRIDAKSQIEKGQGAIFIDRIATAPRNRPWLMSRPDYKGVGSALLLAAVRESYSLGLGGRVWLTSLPSEKTKSYYSKRGFLAIFEDEDGIVDFELPTQKAEQWLKQEGYL